MDRFKYIIPCLFILIFHCSTAFGGEAESMTTFFKRGNDFFKQGDYQQALTYFKQAEQQGLDTPALYYNAGVSLYKLERYKKAENAFEQAASFPRFAPLALYNQGLAAIKQGEKDRARLLFLDVFDRAEGENLGDLAAAALLKLGGRKRTSPWYSAVSLGLGYDDNVGLDADDQTLVTKKGDMFSSISARIRGPVAGLSRRLPGLRFQGSGNYRKYFDQDDFDYGYLGLGLSYRDSLAGWQWETGGDYSYIVFDSKGLEQIPALNLRVSRKLNRTFNFLMKYRLSYLDALNNDYSYLGGWRQNYSAEINLKWSIIRSRVGLGLELNDREDENYSPTRQSVAGGLSFAAWQDLDIYLGINYRRSDFTLVGVEGRQENRFRTVLRLSYLMSGDWRIAGKYKRTVNNSSNSGYDYTRNEIIMSLTKRF